MATKRVLLQDPEYEAIPAELQEKRIKLMEDSVRKQTKKKIENIIRSNFIQEIDSKGSEIDSLDEQLQECRTACDRLRACAITKYYANVGQDPQAPAENNILSVHPSVKKYLGKYPRDIDSDSMTCTSNGSTTEIPVNILNEGSCERISNPSSNEVNKQIEAQSLILSPSKDISSRAPRFKTKSKLVIGNISKFIPVWQRDESDQSTHKWMIYVRGDKNNPNIESFIKKVRFLLHPSYRPTDVVEIYNPPFHLVKRGWGEFPVRVQLHFHDTRNKPVDIIHNLKLDKTYTGLQTLGAETIVELQLFKTDAITNICSVSTLPSSNLPSTSSLQENHESYKELNSSSLTPIKMEIDSDSEASVNTSNTDSVLPFDTVQNHTIVEGPSVENGSEILLNETATSESTSHPSLNRTIVSEPVLPNSLPNSSACNKPLKAAGPNGVNTTYLKCTDTEGRVLIVPQSSLLRIKSQKLTSKQMTNNSTTNSALGTGGADKIRDSKSSVPSYILKVVPNQDSGQNQVLLIPMSEKKVQSSSNSVTNETQMKCVLKPNNLLDNGHGFSVTERFPKKLLPSSYWEQELSNIKIEYYKSMVELLKRVCRAFPLVREGVDRSIDPYCASSLEEYLRWNIGKQRASEWKRAGMVRTALFDLLKKRKLKYLSEESVWSRSTIMSWCRKNGFVPMTSDKLTLLPEPKWAGVELCSVSNAEDLVSTLKEEDSRFNVLGEDEEIEILEVPDDKISTVKNNQNQQTNLHLPPSSEACVYVKEIASQMKVCINPLEVEPSICAPVVEEMILAACRQLATDLIRSSVNEGYNRMGGQLCPEEITVSDVYSAVKATPQFDFLTNSSLGVPKEARGDT